jgi:hypothetical protein
MRLTPSLGAILVSIVLQHGVLHAQTAPISPAKASSVKTASAIEPLQIVLKRSKIATVDGKEVSQSADIAKPGDILEEVATYTNSSKVPMSQLEPTLPVPVNTELVMASVKPTNAKASTDGKNFASIPLKRKIRQPNGVEIEQIVPLSEYKFLRWSVGDLAAEKSVAVSARFKVANSQPVSGSAKTN